MITIYGRWFNIGVCESDDGWIALAGTRMETAVADRLRSPAPRPVSDARQRPCNLRCPTKNIPAVPLARPCSASRRSSLRCAGDRFAAASARRCSTASRSRSRLLRRPGPTWRRPRRSRLAPPALTERDAAATDAVDEFAPPAPVSGTELAEAPVADRFAPPSTTSRRARIAFYVVIDRRAHAARRRAGHVSFPGFDRDVLAGRPARRSSSSARSPDARSGRCATRR